jgi:uncharacterized protein involved in outer membrane biogenesis
MELREEIMAEKNKKNLIVKIVAIFAAVVFLTSIGLAAFLPYFIPWNKIKGKVVEIVKEETGRDLVIGEIEVSWIKGVSVKNIVFSNAESNQGFSKQPMFSSNRASFRFGIFSLLSLASGKLVINSLEFENPRIKIEKSSRGDFNFSSLIKKEKKQSSHRDPEKKEQPLDFKKIALIGKIPVVLASLKVNQADFLYEDFKSKKVYGIEGLDFLLKGFSVAAQGNSRLELGFLARIEEKQVPVKINSDFKIDLAGQKVDIFSLDFQVPSVKVGVSGFFGNILADPVVELKTTTEVDFINLASDLLPESYLKNIPGELKAQGKLKAGLDLKGLLSSVEEAKFNGKIIFEKIGASWGSAAAVSNVSGELIFDQNKASLPELNFELANSPAKLSLSASGYSLAQLMGPTDKIKFSVNYELNSPKLMLEPLIILVAALPTDEKKPTLADVKAGKTIPLEDFSEILPRGFKVIGRVQVDALEYKKIRTGALTHELALQNHQAQSVLALKLFEGEITNTVYARLDKPGPELILQALIRNVQFAPFVDAVVESFPDSNALSELKGKVSGSLNARVNENSRLIGIKPVQFLPRSNLQGSFHIANGIFKSTDMQARIADKIPHQPTSALLRRDIDFERFRGDFSLTNGKLNFKNVLMSSGSDNRGGDLMVQAQGFVNLTGKGVDLKIIPRFNPRVVRLEGVLQDAFGDEQGWASYDHIAYQGDDLKNSKADFKAGAKKAAQKAVKKQVQQVQKKVEEEAKKIIEEKGGELLRNIFGR